MRLTAGDIVAEVDDAARSLDLGQHAGLAGPDVPPVGVAARGISGGDAMRLEVPQCGQVVERGILAKQGRGKRQDDRHAKAWFHGRLWARGWNGKKQAQRP